MLRQGDLICFIYYYFFIIIIIIIIILSSGFESQVGVTLQTQELLGGVEVNSLKYWTQGPSPITMIQEIGLEHENWCLLKIL